LLTFPEHCTNDVAPENSTGTIAAGADVADAEIVIVRLGQLPTLEAGAVSVSKETHRQSTEIVFTTT
jgi:hypothetical protein